MNRGIAFESSALPDPGVLVSARAEIDRRAREHNGDNTDGNRASSHDGPPQRESTLRLNSCQLDRCGKAMVFSPSSTQRSPRSRATDVVTLRPSGLRLSPLTGWFR